MSRITKAALLARVEELTAQRDAQRDAEVALAMEVQRVEALGAALDLAIRAMLEYGPLGIKASDGKSVMDHCLEARRKSGRNVPLPSIPRFEP